MNDQLPCPKSAQPSGRLPGKALAPLLLLLAVGVFLGITTYFPVRWVTPAWGVHLGGDTLQRVPGEMAPLWVGEFEAAPWHGGSVRLPLPPERVGDARSERYYRIGWKGRGYSP